MACLRWLVHTLAPLLLVSGSQGQQPDLPRYILCDEAWRTSWAALQGPSDASGAVVKAYAASVASGEHAPGRQKVRPTLRIALLLDDDSWVVRMPSVANAETRFGNFSEEISTLGHAKNVSYAKCFNEGLPTGTAVSVRLQFDYRRHRTRDNATWHDCRLRRFRNEELAHDFAECELAAFEHLWISRLGPQRLYLELRVEVPALQLQSSSAVLPLELCWVELPLRKVSFCSQPLYGFGQIKSELPWAVEDWLEYHLGHLGFEHADIYDVDGSFQEALAPWVHSRWRRSSINYVGAWPGRLSSRLEAHSKTYPYCTETFAYAHCLTTSRAYSRWVALLHAPDEYLVLPTAERRQGWLPAVLASQDTEEQAGYLTSFLRIYGVSFARGGSDPYPGSERGSVLASSMLRSEEFYSHVPFLNPMLCFSAGAHACYAEEGGLGRSITLEVSPRIMKVHHYVEMMSRNSGRCSTLLKPCTMLDRSLEWAARMLARI